MVNAVGSNVRFRTIFRTKLASINVQTQLDIRQSVRDGFLTPHISRIKRGSNVTAVASLQASKAKF
jgi:hypothetical protein